MIMKSVFITKHGNIEKIQIGELETPKIIGK